MSRLKRTPKWPVLALLIFIALPATPGSSAAADPSGRAIDAAALTNFPAHPHSGFSLAIVHGGKLTYIKGYGFRDDGTPDTFIPDDRNYYGISVGRGSSGRKPADADTIFEIGSVTKQFTAAAILLLAQEHRLQLDDAVNRYAPEYPNSALTVRMLLNQRSGLPDLNTLVFLQRVHPSAKRADGTIDSLLVSREIAKLPVRFAPDSAFEYSNSNYFVLGTIVERITRRSLQRFLSDKIFTPLHMDRTAYAAAAKASDVAVGYRNDAKDNVRRAYPFDLPWLGGAGAITSTARDIARWDAALLDRKLLEPESLREMWQGRESGRGQGLYAMGWVEDALGSHRYVWHNGETGGFHALNVIFPDDALAFCLLTNNQDAQPEFLLPQIASLYFPVRGLDRVLPHSGVVLVEASLVVGLGALAIAIVAIVTLKRFIAAGIVAAAAALLLGFFLPSIIGFVWGGVAAIVPVAAYAAAVRLILPRRRPA